MCSMHDSKCAFYQLQVMLRMVYFKLLLLLLLLHLITHPTKCYTNSKVRALSEKNNSEQVRLQVFRKSRWTNRQIPQFNRQLIPTAGTSNSKGSQTPIRPVADLPHIQTCNSYHHQEGRHEGSLIRRRYTSPSMSALQPRMLGQLSNGLSAARRELNRG